MLSCSSLAGLYSICEWLSLQFESTRIYLLACNIYNHYNFRVHEPSFMFEISGRKMLSLVSRESRL